MPGMGSRREGGVDAEGERQVMMRAACLIRVSDASQVDGYSLDAQRREITRWCESRDYSAKFFVEEGVSAKTDRLDKRPQLQSILAAVERQEFDILVVHTLDRFARNQGVQRHVLEALGKKQVGFATVVGGHEFTTSAGRMMMSVMGAVNEFFSDQLAEHVAKAVHERAEVGLPVGPIPFGYLQLEPGGVPVAEADKAAVIRHAFSRRADGESCDSIAKWVNDQGFLTKGGNWFAAHAMKDIFNCHFYVGIVTYKGTEYPGQHESIITEELFRAVQDRRHGPPGPRKTWGAAGTLQGLIACGNCGTPVQSDRSRLGAPMYRERHSLDCFTNGRSAMAEPFDEQIGNILRSVELPCEWRNRMAQLAMSEYSGPSTNDLRAKRKRLGIAFVDGAIGQAEYNRRKADIEAQTKEANSVVPPSIEDAVELFQHIESLWKEATREECRRLLRPLIERVHVDMDLKLVGAITPTPAFRALLQCAVRKSGSDVVLASHDDMERLGVWSWWRRGRIELPVQKKHVKDLLQAYLGI